MKRQTSLTGQRLASPSRSPLYVFRSTGFARAGESVVSAAPLDRVVSLYGGGGMHGEAGLAAAFGGAAFFRDGPAGEIYLGVWGARNASRFRAALRASGGDWEIIHGPPPARLVWRSATGVRPVRP